MYKVAVYSTKPYDKNFLQKAAQGHNVEFHYFEDSLSEETADFARGFEAVCIFVNDRATRHIVEKLAANGVRLIVLRSAGFNHVDLEAVADHGIKVVRVPAYSPYAVAEHALAMIMTLNRKTHRAFNRVRENNFSLNGLIGFDLHGKTVGVIGTGKIGSIFCKIMLGLGCNVIGNDPYPDEEVRKMGVTYHSLEELFRQSDIISLQCPLTPQTHHLINKDAIHLMKEGVMLINTSRGGLIDTKALITGLKSGKIGYLGMDVYEQEENLFFKDLSDQIIHDDLIMRLITFPNVLITSHQAFFTENAMKNIAETTVSNINQFLEAKALDNEVKSEKVHA
ncbi:D-lactate dehydrogenase [Fulvivirga imtechensis AK7]|uniref:D-lactate dehydrogenase n=1 Tax=Fulvivirga imtechensis AK7 TaxID=1237149 RepID=L8JUP6_9BACT|nr:2-hydroxyacid dehydrogenase [Fulvivirga imtechensis]ELR71963.1 D-lactate dehydrogenase [Fulvivirga imtechensis AK7]